MPYAALANLDLWTSQVYFRMTLRCMYVVQQLSTPWRATQLRLSPLHCMQCAVSACRNNSLQLWKYFVIIICYLFITVLTAFWGESFRLSPILRCVMREEMNSFVLSALLREQRGKKRARVWLPCWVCSECRCRGDEHCASVRELVWAVQCKAAQFIKRVCCVSQMRRIRGGRDSVWLTGRGSVPTGQRWPEASWKLARSIFHPC